MRPFCVVFVHDFLGGSYLYRYSSVSLCEEEGSLSAMILSIMVPRTGFFLIYFFCVGACLDFPFSSFKIMSECCSVWVSGEKVEYPG